MKPIAEIATDVVVGHVGPSSQAREQTGVPFLMGKNVRDSGLILDDLERVSRSFHESQIKSQLRPGDVVVVRIGKSGTAAIVPPELKEANCAGLVVIKAPLSVDARFLVRYLNAPDAQRLALQQARGSTRGTLNTHSVRETLVPVPPLPEQRRIADILDKADSIRRKRKEAIALTEELLRSAFLEMFGDPVTNPKGWPVRALGEVSVVAGGLQVTSARASNPISAPYLRVANVYRDRLDLTEIKELRVTEAEYQRAVLQHGDVLVVEGHGNPEELGRAAVWRGEISGCLHQNHLIRVRSDSTRLDSAYLAAFLNSPSGKMQMIERGKTTSGLNTISSNNVRSVQVVLPPLLEQMKFKEVLLRVSSIQAQLGIVLDRSDTLFNCLVARAFSPPPGDLP